MITRTSAPTAALDGLFSLSVNDLTVVREHFAALDPAEFGWIVEGIDAEMAER